MELSQTEVQLLSCRQRVSAILGEAQAAVATTARLIKQFDARSDGIHHAAERVRDALDRANFESPPLPMIGESAAARARIRVPAGPHFVFDPYNSVTDRVDEPPAAQQG